MAQSATRSEPRKSTGGRINRVTIYESDRTFRVERWSIGHSWLILRSLRTDETPSTLEISFKPVRAICIGQSLDGLRISKTESEPDLSAAIAVLGRPHNKFESCFTVDSRNSHGWVVCGAVAGREDPEGDYPPSMFSGDFPRTGVETLFSYHTTS